MLHSTSRWQIHLLSIWKQFVEGIMRYFICSTHRWWCFLVGSNKFHKQGKQYNVLNKLHWYHRVNSITTWACPCQIWLFYNNSKQYTRALIGVWREYMPLLRIKPGSQYDAHASIASWASRASGWCWNRLDFYSSIASRALASVQPIRSSKNLMSGWCWKNTFFHDARDTHGASVILWTRLNYSHSPTNGGQVQLHTCTHTVIAAV